jgi:ABC-type sugar transport system ATPase subunit
MTSPVTMRDVRLEHPGTQALAGVDLDANPGDVGALLGGNGAGRSTLMKGLAWAVHPDAGSIQPAG